MTATPTDLLHGATLFRAWLMQPPHDIRRGPDAAWQAFDSWVAFYAGDTESDAAEALRDSAITLAAQAAKLA